jgi:serine/threonine-protein kinase
MTEVKAALAGVNPLEPAVKPVEEQPSIAVLPFANMSADKDQEYFSDGLTEEIINTLSQIPDLKVTARTSAFAFRGKEQDIVKIAEALHVRTILEGSVRKAGNRVRITAQLINASDGYYLWSQRFDRELSDIFTLQDEIAASIASALRVKLTRNNAPVHQPNLPAYEAYLRGRYHILQNDPDSLDLARMFLEEAVRLDPKYAAPHAEMGVRYYLLAAWGSQPAATMIPLARAQAAKALELSPAEPQGHVVLGALAAAVDRDWDSAREHFEQALASDPVPPDVQMRYGFFYLCGLGRAQEALEIATKVLELDPLNFLWHGARCGFLSFLGRYEESIEEGRKSLAIKPDAYLSLFYLSISYIRVGKLQEAREALETIDRLSPQNFMGCGMLAWVYRQIGERAKSEKMLARLLDNQSGSNASMGIAMYHMLSGENDTAAEWLMRSMENQDLLTGAMIGSALFAPLKSGPHWPQLRKMLNLPAGVE